jgi:thiol-disulfide isomerase/thioredoxin
MRTVKRHNGGKRRAKNNGSRSMPPIISVSRNGSITPYKTATSKTKTKTKSKSKANNNISLNVRNEAEADNALEIMKKSPITIVLVFANWCPHCHSYMETWNKLKKLPNRAPMVEMDAAADGPGASEAVKEFLSSIKGPDGAPMEVNAFPTVLSVKNNKGSLEAEPVENSRDEAAMEEMLLNNAPKGAIGNVAVNSMELENSKSSGPEEPESANKDVASMEIPSVADSVRTATKSLEENLKMNSRRAGLSNIPTATPKEATVKPASISRAALNAEEEAEDANANVFENKPTPDFTAPPVSQEELDSGESEASRKAAPPGLAGGGSLYQTLSTYAAGSPLLVAAAPAAILLAAQQTAARRARIGKPKTRKGGAKKRKTRRRA